MQVRDLWPDGVARTSRISTSIPGEILGFGRPAGFSGTGEIFAAIDRRLDQRRVAASVVLVDGEQLPAVAAQGGHPPSSIAYCSEDRKLRWPVPRPSDHGKLLRSPSLGNDFQVRDGLLQPAKWKRLDHDGKRGEVHGGRRRD